MTAGVSRPSLAAVTTVILVLSRPTYGLAMAAKAVLEAPDGNAEAQVLALWDPRTGRFDAPLLRTAMVLRGWTPDEFARAAGIGRTTIYKVLAGDGVRDRTAIAIFQGLALKRPRIGPS